MMVSSAIHIVYKLALLFTQLMPMGFSGSQGVSEWGDFLQHNGIWQGTEDRGRHPQPPAGGICQTAHIWFHPVLGRTLAVLSLWDAVSLTQSIMGSCVQRVMVLGVCESL